MIYNSNIHTSIVYFTDDCCAPNRVLPLSPGGGCHEIAAPAGGGAVCRRTHVVLLLVAVTPTISLARVAAPVSISLSASSAQPGDKIFIRGQDQKPIFAGCLLSIFKADGEALENELIGGSCSHSEVGQISGSFVVPAGLKSSTLQVTVCVSGCLKSNPPEPRERDKPWEATRLGPAGGGCG
jgi:hypothetical protein